jgi:hypothetical protein
MRRSALLAPLALAIAGCTANAEQARTQSDREASDLAKALEGRVAGKQVSCVSTVGLEGPQIIGNHTLVYRQGGRVYRNDLVAACPSLSSDDTILIEIHGSQLCRNDQFRVIDPGTTIPSGYCRLDKFTPYTRR